MLVGLPSDPEVRRIHRARSRKSVEYAIEKIKASPIAPYIQHLYLYGSCARDQQDEFSDVDLFLQLADDFPLEQLREQVVLLKSKVIPLDSEMPEVDLNVVVGSKWRSNSSLYYENIRRDGIELWTKAIPI